jgi:V-type H+-transporting ATPase proteolipid subunit
MVEVQNRENRMDRGVAGADAPRGPSSPNFKSAFCAELPGSKDPSRVLTHKSLVVTHTNPQISAMTNAQLLTGLGAAISIFLSSAGACAASVPSGLFALSSRGIQGFFPIIISGVLAIYGCIIAVILSGKINQDDLTATDGYRHLSAGLSVGLACLASGLGMARFVDMYTNSSPSRPAASSSMEEPLVGTATARLQVSYRFLMVLVFIEAIGLYGLVVALLLSV